jgi:formylglycine-generating enzyme required for sulfatase activity/outer membrane biosynthesis protein TonB
MAPELFAAEGGRGSAQSDIYSIGVTFYMALTKKLPFTRLPEKEADAYVAIIRRIESPPPVPFEHPVFTRHPELVPILSRALSFKPDKRQASAKQMADEIKEVLDGWERVKIYEVAMAVGNAALEDYKEAEIQAAKALNAAPKDERAKQLLQGAQGVRRALYGGAMAVARSALAKGNFDEAILRAKKAADLMPSETDPKKFMAQVQAAIVAKAAEADLEERPTVAPQRPKEVSDLDEAETSAPTLPPFARKPEAPKKKDAPAPAAPPKKPSAPATPKPEPPPPPAKKEEPVRPEVVKERKPRKPLPIRGILIGMAAVGLAVGLFYGWRAYQERSAEIAREHEIEAQAVKKANYDAAMKAGNQAFDSGDYKNAMAQADIALGNKSGDGLAAALKVNAKAKQDEIDAKQKDYDDDIAAAKAALEQKEADSALARVRKILDTRPGDMAALALEGEAQKMLDDAKAQAEQETRYNSLLAAANTASASGDFDAVVKNAEAILAFRPGDDRALKLEADAKKQVQDLKDRADRQAKYDASMADAREALGRSDYQAAVARAGDALGVVPNDPAATSLRQGAQAKLDELIEKTARDKKYADAIALARSALAKEDFEAASSQADAALTSHPDDPDATNLKKEAQDRQRERDERQAREKAYSEAMAEGTAALKGGQFEAAGTKADMALREKPDDPAAVALKSEARKQLEAARETEANYDAALQRSRDAFALRHFITARAQANLALHFKADSAEAKKLVADAQAQLDRQPARTDLKDFLGIPGFDFVWVQSLEEGEGAYVQQAELSQTQFQALGAKMAVPSTKMQISNTGPDDPENLAFEDAAQLLDGLNKAADSLHPPGRFHLPSRTEYLVFSEVRDLSAGDNPSYDAMAALFSRDGADVGGGSLHLPRGVKEGPPNRYRLYNVLGNAWEWCDDRSGAGYGYDSTFGSIFRTHAFAQGLYTGLRLVFVPND